MVNPFELTLDALYLTFTGQAPVSVWFPLFRDIGMIIFDKVTDILEVLM